MTAADNVSPISLKHRLGACLFWFALTTVFGFSGWYFMWDPVAGALGNWWQARDFIATPATVFSKEEKDADGTFTWHGARYTRNGRDYQTSRLSVLETDRIDEGINESISKNLQNAMSAGRGIDVWVSPRRPDVAIISRDLPIGSLWDRALVGIGFAVFTVAGIAGVIGALLNTRFYRRQHDVMIVWVMAAFWCGFTFPMFMLVVRSNEWFGVVFVAVFALVGVMLLYVATHTSITGARTQAQFISKSSRSGLARERSVKRSAKGNAKRGGLGGRGDDFDKN
jgi:hypothetical protein